MSTFREEWENYIKVEDKLDVESNQYIQFKEAFYSGAFIALNLIANMDVDYKNNIYDEISKEAFRLAFRKKQDV